MSPPSPRLLFSKKNGMEKIKIEPKRATMEIPEKVMDELDKESTRE